MKAAIYARKSREAEKGESLDNQINRGIALCEARGFEYEIYQDMAWSGKSLDRPDFNRMYRDINHKRIHTVICYKLDRVSRNVNDFSSLINDLTSKGVDFISLTENFDTSSPLGRAMMYISSVFAQLERETTAERVKDNMFDQASSGTWNGGPVPFGFDRLERKDGNKKYSLLVINQNESEAVSEMFRLYIKTGSIKRVAYEINKLGIKSKLGYGFRQSMVSRILNNPIYAKATPEVFEYYKNKVKITSSPEQFDGKHGLIMYGKRNSQKDKLEYNHKESWQLSVGQHEGIIDGSLYALAQIKRDINSKKPSRTDTSLQSFLIGLVKCGKCGYRMMIGISGKNKNDEPYRYFRCHTKFDLHTCDQKSIRADRLENYVLEYLDKMLRDPKRLEEKLSGRIACSGNNDSGEKLKILEKQISKVKQEQDKLLDFLLNETINQDVYKRKNEALKKEQTQLELRVNEMMVEQNEIELSKENVEYIINLARAKQIDNESTFEQKKDFVRSFIKEIVVTDENKTDGNVRIVTFFDL